MKSEEFKAVSTMSVLQEINTYLRSWRMQWEVPMVPRWIWVLVNCVFLPLLAVLCIGGKYGFYSWLTKEILVLKEPSSTIPGAVKATQTSVQKNIQKSWRKYSCLLPQMGLNIALPKNIWKRWSLPGMEAALCGLHGVGAEPEHGLWTLHLTWGSHVHPSSC